MGQPGNSGSSDQEEIVAFLYRAEQCVAYARSLARFAETPPTKGLTWKLDTAQRYVAEAGRAWKDADG
jgi:hypothetical protein